MSLPVRQHRTAARFAKRPVIIERSANNGGPLRPRLCVLWKRHIHCRRDQQVRGHQSGGGGVLTQVPRARRSLSLRAELRCCSIVVLGSAAQQSGGVASVRERPFRSPAPAVACLGGRLHSVSPDGGVDIAMPASKHRKNLSCDCWQFPVPPSPRIFRPRPFLVSTLEAEVPRTPAMWDKWSTVAPE
jgi:hypothetical protein